MMDEQTIKKRQNRNILKVVIPTFDLHGTQSLRVFAYKSKQTVGQVLHQAQQALADTECGQYPQGLYVSIACNENNPTVVCALSATGGSSTFRKGPKNTNGGNGFWLDPQTTFGDWGLEGEVVAELKLKSWELVVVPVVG